MLPPKLSKLNAMSCKYSLKQVVVLGWTWKIPATPLKSWIYRSILYCEPFNLMSGHLHHFPPTLTISSKSANTLWPIDAIRRGRLWLALTQVDTRWHKPLRKAIFTYHWLGILSLIPEFDHLTTQDINRQVVFEIYTFEIISSPHREHWADFASATILLIDKQTSKQTERQTKAGRI